MKKWFISKFINHFLYIGLIMLESYIKFFERNDISKIDPFDEEDWDEKEIQTYKLYFDFYNRPKIILLNNSFNKFKYYEFVGGSLIFGDDLSKTIFNGLFYRYCNYYKNILDREIRINNADIEKLLSINYDLIKKLKNLNNNELIIFDNDRNLFKIGRIKHIRGDRWGVINIGNLFRDLSSKEYKFLTENGYYKKNSTFFLKYYNKDVENTINSYFNKKIKSLENDISDIYNSINIINSYISNGYYVKEIDNILKD